MMTEDGGRGEVERRDVAPCCKSGKRKDRRGIKVEACNVCGVVGVGMSGVISLNKGKEEARRTVHSQSPNSKTSN
jgi:hypothetical protein